MEVALSKNGGRDHERDVKLVGIAIQEINCDILIPFPLYKAEMHGLVNQFEFGLCRSLSTSICSFFKLIYQLILDQKKEVLL